MALFDHRNRERNEETRRVYAQYEIAHTIADFIAATSFLIGSILFLWARYETQAIWFFIVGSIFFCIKPTLRLARELKLWRMGDLDDLSRRLED
jgi:uncharacterized membrane protein YhfC